MPARIPSRMSSNASGLPATSAAWSPALEEGETPGARSGDPVPAFRRFRNPRDFHVEEVPNYAPSGRGDHCYLWIEKAGISTPEAVRRLAAAAGCPEADIGH